MGAVAARDGVAGAGVGARRVPGCAPGQQRRSSARRPRSWWIDTGGRNRRDDSKRCWRVVGGRPPGGHCHRQAPNAICGVSHRHAVGCARDRSHALDWCEGSSGLHDSGKADACTSKPGHGYREADMEVSGAVIWRVDAMLSNNVYDAFGVLMVASGSAATQWRFEGRFCRRTGRSDAAHHQSPSRRSGSRYRRPVFRVARTFFENISRVT